MAVGLHIGCPRLVGRQKVGNSNLQEFFCTMQYFYSTTLNGIEDQIFQRRARGGALNWTPLPYLQYCILYFHFNLIT